LESRFLVRLQEVEKVVPKALETGMSIFVMFEQRATAAGNALLRYMATLGEGAIISQESLAPHCPGTLENLLKVLKQLELI
jgi:DNA-binding IclR family transcriptional regulator